MEINQGKLEGSSDPIVGVSWNCRVERLLPALTTCIPDNRQASIPYKHRERHTSTLMDPPISNLLPKYAELDEDSMAMWQLVSSWTGLFRLTMRDFFSDHSTLFHRLLLL